MIHSTHTLLLLGTLCFCTSAVESISNSPSLDGSLLLSKVTILSPPSTPTLSSSAPSTTPTQTQTETLSLSPSLQPTVRPSKQVTSQPSENIPKVGRSLELSPEPSSVPSSISSLLPSIRPSSLPTNSLRPSSIPSNNESSNPTSINSTSSPTNSLRPSSIPTNDESNNPTSINSTFPSAIPSSASGKPSLKPTSSQLPTQMKSSNPTAIPSSKPTSSLLPTDSSIPTQIPSLSVIPSLIPTTSQTPTESSIPSFVPSSFPSEESSSRPTLSPSPTRIQSDIPSIMLTTSEAPTELKSDIPSSFRSPHPTTYLTPTPSPCADSTKWFLVELLSKKVSRSCQWVKENRKCHHAIAQERCPTTCDSCTCRDTVGYFQNTLLGMEIDCKWFLEKDGRCDDPLSKNCPYSCGRCEETSFPTLRPSQSWSVSPSNDPTKAESNVPSLSPVPCIDYTEKFPYTNDRGDIIEKDCSFISRAETEKRCKKDGVKEFCPVTCNVCPKLSPVPSENKSSLPSVEPSITISSEPTIKLTVPPTETPTTTQSQNPSTFPPVKLIYEKNVTAQVVIGFESFSIDIKDDEVEEAFLDITKKHLTKTMKRTDGIDIDILSLSVDKMVEIKDVKDGVRNSRMLQDDEGTKSMGSIVDLIVVGEISSTMPLPMSFSFIEHIVYGLENDFSEYKNSLQQDTIISKSLLGSKNDDQRREETRSLSLYIYIGCSVAGGILISFLTILFIKNRQHRDRLERLPSNLTFQDENVFVNSQGAVGVPYGSILRNDSVNIHDAYYGKGGPVEHPVIRRGLSRSTSRSTSRSASRGSPRSASRGSPRSASRGQLEGDDAYMTWQGSFGEPQFGYQDNGESFVTRNESGNNGGGMSYDQRHFMDHHNNMLATRTETGSETDSLGLNVSPDALFEAKRQSQQFSFVPQERSDINRLYPYEVDNSELDCITFNHDCPPGPLGLVIDTTTRGPMVHSVKSNSSLSGYIEPGDIIIAFDDNDTRNMTAPLITSLIASKSQHRRRRLTILRYQ